MYRPQFPLPPAPPGFVYQPCVYQFDRTNTPAFTGISLATGQQTDDIPLPLDTEAPFTLLGIKIENSSLNVKLWSPYGDELMDDFLKPAEYASEIPPFTVLEGPGIYCQAGSVFAVRLQGQ
jgi:hypothetical protein